MQREPSDNLGDSVANGADLQSLLHPAQAFEHPRNVLNDRELTINEKRAILASWASDACAIEAAPALRHPDGVREPVRFDEIMDALRELDRQARAQGIDDAPCRRLRRKRRLFSRRHRSQDEGDGQAMT
jgi:hypothetical protein